MPDQEPSRLRENFRFGVAQRLNASIKALFSLGALESVSQLNFARFGGTNRRLSRAAAEWESPARQCREAKVEHSESR